MPKWFFFCIVTLLLWGAWGVVSKAIGDALSASHSQALSTLALLPIILVLAPSKAPHPTDRKLRGITYAFLGGLASGLGNIGYFKALNLAGAKASTIIPLTSLYPVVTVPLAMVVLKERLRPLQIAGIVIALLAIYLFNMGEPVVGQQVDVVSIWLAWALIPIVLWGMAALLSKMSTGYISPELSTAVFLGAFVPIAAIIMLTDPVSWDISARVWVLVLLLGLTLGLGNLTVLIAYASAGKASVVTPLCGLYSVVSIPLAIVLLGEHVLPHEWIAIALALVAVVALSQEKQSS